MDNGSNLVLWVESKKGHAFWVDEFVRGRYGGNQIVQAESLRVYENPFSPVFDVAYVGDWIMQRQNGQFEVIRPQTLDADYVQV